jgi:FAD/FMN-containing dehydrogenase
MTGLNRVLELADGWARVEAGIVMFDLNEAARKTGQQLRMWPSTERIATLGGFIAGGHSGIGSIRHGILADPGNVRALQVVTLEDPPRLVELRGADIQKAHHAYGTNGILVSVDIALTGAVDWQHVIALFPDYPAALQCALDIGQRVCQAGSGALDVFQLSTVERRITPYYDGLRERLQDQDAIFAQVAPASIDTFEACVRAAGGNLAVRGTESELIAAGLPPATECAYNHTTLQALKTDRSVTYLQVAYPVPFDPRLVAAQCERFGDEESGVLVVDEDAERAFEEERVAERGGHGGGEGLGCGLDARDGQGSYPASRVGVERFGWRESACLVDVPRTPRAGN